MKVRAKFTVLSKTELPDGYEVTMAPSGDKGDGEEFWKWTPYGTLSMGLIAKGTADSFEVGRDYYLDFTPAED